MWNSKFVPKRSGNLRSLWSNVQSTDYKWMRHGLCKNVVNAVFGSIHVWKTQWVSKYCTVINTLVNVVTISLIHSKGRSTEKLIVVIFTHSPVLLISTQFSSDSFYILEHCFKDAIRYSPDLLIFPQEVIEIIASNLNEGTKLE